MRRWGQGYLSGARGLPGASAVAISAKLLITGVRLQPCVVHLVALKAAGCCFVSAALVHVGCFLLLPVALGLSSVLLFCVAGSRSWAGFPPWSVPSGVFCCVFAAAPIPTIATFVTHASRVTIRIHDCSVPTLGVEAALN